MNETYIVEFKNGITRYVYASCRKHAKILAQAENIKYSSKPCLKVEKNMSLNNKIDKIISKK